MRKVFLVEVYIAPKISFRYSISAFIVGCEEVIERINGAMKKIRIFEIAVPAKITF